MPVDKVKFSGGETPSVDELAGGVPAQVNVLTDAAGAIRVRPGISTFSGFPSDAASTSEIIQIGAWNGYVIYVSDDRRIWALGDAGVITELSNSSSPTSFLDGSLRPIITPLRDRVIVTGGGAPQQWLGSGLSTPLGGSPPRLTHSVAISQRLVGNANDPSGIIYWSDINAPESWPTGLNFLEAETKQDAVIGLYENTNELVALGTESVQMFSPDPSVVFSPSRTMEFGWGPAHSYVQLDEKFMGLDSRNRFILSNGRSFQTISSPHIGQQLEDAGVNVADCWGCRYKVGNYDLGIWTMPTDGRTFVYDTTSKTWCEFRGYDTASSALGRFSITAHFYWKERKLNLVGLSNGQIAILDETAFTDLGANIVAQMTSTFESRATSRQKKCNGVRLRFKRGILAPGDAGQVLLSYRDDLGAFCEPFRLDIGDPSDVAPVVAIRSLGSYRQRQWRIVVDSAAFRFADFEEDYQALNS